MATARKRITVKHNHANPLFEQWLTEWRDQAKEQGSKMQHCFSLALYTLRKYPMPLATGKDCKILKGFGDKLCNMLDNRLKEYRSQNQAINAGPTPPKIKKSNNLKTPRTPKEYLPQVGSGAFAILVTLFEKSEEPDYPGYMTKNEIIEHGQRFCNVSFSKPGPDTRYTGWSSMKTLLEKSLVHKKGNPAKFSLTLEGKVLADNLYVLQKVEEFKKLEDRDNFLQNATLFSDDCHSKPSTSKVCTVTQEGKNDCLQNPTPFPLVCQSKRFFTYDQDLERLKSAAQFSDDTPSTKALNDVVQRTRPFSLDDYSKASTSKANIGLQEDIIDFVHSTIRSMQDGPSTSTAENNVEPAKTRTLGANSASTSSQNSTHETVILPPDSFEIVLLVDTQELNASKGDPDNDPIILHLKRLGVSHEIRHLKIGDYTWICRDGSGTELVLPYIIERKRMDDLGESIKDTRFHEQKFRLKQCGIPNLIYLVENYGKNEHVGLPLKTLHQAAINTLVHDGFTVKFTKNGKESCEYLETMTILLTKLFKDKTLVSCPKPDLPEFIIGDDLIHIMLFTEFNKSAAKTKHFKVSEMFVRILLKIKGMSIDKAMAIVEKYPTPLILKTTYSDAEEPEGEKFLADIRYGPSKRKVGPVLSKIVYQLFSKYSY